MSLVHFEASLFPVRDVFLCNRIVILYREIILSLDSIIFLIVSVWNRRLKDQSDDKHTLLNDVVVIKAI